MHSHEKKISSFNQFSDVEKCQTEGFDWQNFIRTDKILIFLLHILLFGLTRFSKSVEMTGMSKKILTSLSIHNFLSSYMYFTSQTKEFTPDDISWYSWWLVIVCHYSRDLSKKNRKTMKGFLREPWTKLVNAFFSSIWYGPSRAPFTWCHILWNLETVKI